MNDITLNIIILLIFIPIFILSLIYLKQHQSNVLLMIFSFISSIFFMYTDFNGDLVDSTVYALEELDDELLKQIPKSKLPESSFPLPNMNTSLSTFDNKPLNNAPITLFSLEFSYCNKFGWEFNYDYIFNPKSKLEPYVSNGMYNLRMEKLHAACADYNAGKINYSTFFNEVYKSPLVQQSIHDPKYQETGVDVFLNRKKNVFPFNELSKGLMNRYHDGKTYTSDINYTYNPAFEIMQVELWNLLMYGKHWQYFYDQVNLLFDGEYLNTSKTPGQILYELTSLINFCMYDQNPLVTVFYLLAPDSLISKPLGLRESALNLIHLKTLQLLVHPDTNFVIKEFIVNEFYLILCDFLVDVFLFMDSEHMGWGISGTQSQLFLDYLIYRAYLFELNLSDQAQFLESYVSERYRFHWYTSSWLYWLDTIDSRVDNFMYFFDSVETGSRCLPSRKIAPITEFYDSAGAPEFNLNIPVTFQIFICLLEEDLLNSIKEFKEDNQEFLDFLKKYKILYVLNSINAKIFFIYKYVLIVGIGYSLYLLYNPGITSEIIKTVEYVVLNIFKDWPPDGL